MNQGIFKLSKQEKCPTCPQVCTPPTYITMHVDICNFYLKAKSFKQFRSVHTIVMRQRLGQIWGLTYNSELEDCNEHSSGKIFRLKKEDYIEKFVLKVITMCFCVVFGLNMNLQDPFFYGEKVDRSVPIMVF